MFSAIVYQLQSIGICNVDGSKLREMLAAHLEDNGSSYRQFLSEPVASNDAYNADTEPPTDEYAYIDGIADSVYFAGIMKGTKVLTLGAGR